MISNSSYFNHYQHDLLGNVHPSTMREIQSAAEDVGPSSLDAQRETPLLRSTVERRKVWCDFKAYCSGGHYVASTTFFRHKKLWIDMRVLAPHLG